jgi:hypothetical protein
MNGSQTEGRKSYECPTQQLKIIGSAPALFK